MTPTFSVVRRQWLLFAVWLVVCSLVFLRPCAAAFNYAMHNDNASHILLIPFLVAWLIYLDRQKIVPRSVDLSAALLLALPAAAIWAFALRQSFADATVPLALSILAFVLFIAAGFVALFGRDSAKATWSSLTFLLFLVPFPEPILSKVIHLLQVGSAAVTDVVFDLSGAPVLREGFVFHLPKVSIEVAQECSGIRSSIALVILALLVARFAFRAFWKKLVFVAAGLAMMLIKNGIRIATLTLLANYVNPDFLYGKLHHEGGIVFFLIGLALLWPVYYFLRKGEMPEPAAITQQKTS
ncbi:MAG TPA: exosortase/archaeosortase family protein [Candidatus Dormibacteraeota bacterium]|nr:exosortase/archaeosortase family protein [Candidatus Dormibacteraeota bacterium]